MTALRQQTFEMFESVTEENLLQIIRFIQARKLTAIKLFRRFKATRHRRVFDFTDTPYFFFGVYRHILINR